MCFGQPDVRLRLRLAHFSGKLVVEIGKMQKSLMFGRERNGMWISPRRHLTPHPDLARPAVKWRREAYFEILLAC